MGNALDSDGWLDFAAAKQWCASQGSTLLGVGLYPQANLGQPQLQEAARQGIGLWPFYENKASDPDGGEPQGRLDAQNWARLADQLHQPQQVPIPADDDQVVPNLQVTIDYFAGFADELVRVIGRRAGFYGQTSIWEDIKGFGYSWFCKAPDGWDKPPWPPDADVIQSVQYPGTVINGVGADIDEILKPNGFMWNADGMFPAQPKPPEEEVDSIDVTVTFRGGFAQGLVAGTTNIGKKNVPLVPFLQALSATLVSGAGADVTIAEGPFLVPATPNGTDVRVNGSPDGASVTVRVSIGP